MGQAACVGGEWMGVKGEVGERWLHYKCFSRRYLEWLPHSHVVKSGGSSAASQMSVNETFILSTIVDSAYATYEVGKTQIKIEGEGEHARERQKGFISMRLGGGALVTKAKLNLLVHIFFSPSEPSVLALTGEPGLMGTGCKNSLKNLF